ncbi:MAG: NUDIX domain-containing protein [Pseudomonadota bacterium]
MRTFGERMPGRAYPDRPGAYGFVANTRGEILTAEGPGPGRYLPGGGLEAGETHEHGLVREFAEETGLTIRPAGLLYEACQLIPCLELPHGYLKICRFFAVELTPAEQTIAPRFPIQWLPQRQALEDLEEEVQRWALRMWLDQGRPLQGPLPPAP